MTLNQPPSPPLNLDIFWESVMASITGMVLSLNTEMTHLSTNGIYQKTIWVVHRVTRKDGGLGLKDSQEKGEVGSLCPSKNHGGQTSLVTSNSNQLCSC